MQVMLPPCTLCESCNTAKTMEMSMRCPTSRLNVISLTMEIWRWESHWKVQLHAHWNTFETTLKNFTKDNHTFFLSHLNNMLLLSVIVIQECKSLLIQLKIFSVTHIIFSLNFQRYSDFSVWFSVPYSCSAPFCSNFICIKSNVLTLSIDGHSPKHKLNYVLFFWPDFWYVRSRVLSGI